MDQLSLELDEAAPLGSERQGPSVKRWEPQDSGLNLYFMLFPGPGAADCIFRCAAGL